MTKYQIVEQWIKDGLQSGRLKPGDRLPSEAELVSQFSVARNSVRQALNNLSAKGYVETRKGVGTFCLALDNVHNRSRDIGLLCYSSTTYIFPELIAACSSVLNRAGYHLLLNQTEADLQTERKMLQSFLGRGVAGILIEPVFSGEGTGNRDTLLELIAEGVSVVLLDNCFSDTELSYVALDDKAAGRIAASHLLHHGHRRIAVTYTAGYYPKLLRRDGALEAFAENGVTVPDDWLVSYEGLHTPDVVRRQAADILSAAGERPTAFFCSSDEEAIDVAHAVEALGMSIPDDVSIVGIDNSNPGRRIGLGLTTVDHPTRYMAELATSLLVQSIRYPDVTVRSSTLVQPRLIERNSVSKPPREGGEKIDSLK